VQAKSGVSKGRQVSVQRTIQTEKKGQRQSGNERVVYIYRKMKERAKIHPSSLAVPSAACQASCHTAINNAVPVQ